MKNSKPKSIGEVAKHCNISVRTLRHYDAIHLLKPSYRTQASYRLYSNADLEKLYDILVFRALGFSLNRIANLLTANTDDRLALLKQQQKDIDQHITRLKKLQMQLSNTIEQEESTMKNNQFEAFDGFDPDQYEAETTKLWGDTEAYKESTKRTKHYSKDDWNRYNNEVKLLNEQLAEVMDQDLPAESDQAIAVVEQMRLLIDQWFYPCSKEMHANLGDMYTMDDRFTKHYDEVRSGLANYLMLATKANLNTHSV